MGGRGSGGSRGGGGASKSINAKTENELNYLLNKSYKYIHLYKSLELI